MDNITEEELDTVVSYTLDVCSDTQKQCMHIFGFIIPTDN